jgi:hypothetical protein
MNLIIVINLLINYKYQTSDLTAVYAQGI